MTLYVSSDSAFKTVHRQGRDADRSCSTPLYPRRIQQRAPSSPPFPDEGTIQGHFFPIHHPRSPDGEQHHRTWWEKSTYMGSAITNGAYFIGRPTVAGRTDFASMKRFNNDPTIGAYRAHTARAWVFQTDRIEGL